MEIKLKVPKTLKDIKLGTYRKWAAIFEKNKDNVQSNFLEIKLLEIFCGVTAKEAQMLPVEVASDAIDHVIELLNQEPNLTERFKMTGSDNHTVEFGFIPNLSKMTMGEYIDLDTYIGNPEELNRAMAVLYRPIHKSWENNMAYRIADYEGTEYMYQVMDDMPLEYAFGALVFFYRLESKLLNYTMLSSVAHMTAESLIHSAEERGNLQTVTDGIKAYMRLQEEMRSESKMRRSYLYTPA